jgi:adenine-specific DNA-methyltransferase
MECVGALAGVQRVLDLFSGSCRVAHALKALGYQVIANDHNAYAATLARCYVEADAEDVLGEAQAWIEHLQGLAPRAGWFTETFCERSRFFQVENGAKIEAIREGIEEAALREPLRSVLLTALMEAADRVDSTTGVHMAYLKGWSPRAHRPLQLRLPDVLPRARAGKGMAYERDALEVANEEVDLVYLDPPYNQHKYLGNYHIWETLVRWDRPEFYGRACKRVDCRTRKSAFNQRGEIEGALRTVISSVRARFLLVSFSDEGFVDRETMEGMLAERGEVLVDEFDHPRYIGARIGIFNGSGKKVGKVGRLHNRERLYLVRC